MSEETEKALLEIVTKARALHEDASDPQEDNCDALADWIEAKFGL